MDIKKLLPLLAIPLIFCALDIPKNQEMVDTNAKVKAFFIYHFSKHIEWPEKMKESDFKIGIFGDYPTLFQELKAMATSKKAGNQNFKIIRYKHASHIDNCHILYIESEKSSYITQIANNISHQNTLIVTDQTGLIDKGAGINFYYQQNKQKLEINRSNIEKYGLKVSNQLLEVPSKIK